MSSSSSTSVLPSPSSTRLVTIVAHVDHGKTTLADNLIESNGIISERLAGTLRYLDSDPEEQRRGITMRASAIGLRHAYVPPKGAAGGGGGAKRKKKMESAAAAAAPAAGAANHDAGATTAPTAAARRDTVIHLLDSPGHVDFSAEVSSSLLLCDGALLVVDAVEGMCARTHNILREAHLNELVPVLVVNKIDRLCTDLGLSPVEAYVRLRGLVESVNAAAAAMIISTRRDAAGAAAAGAADAAPVAATAKETAEGGDGCECDDGGVIVGASARVSSDTKDNGNDNDDDEDDGIWNFDPVRGNVVFASALHGWGFTVPSLARSLFRSKTIPLKPVVLRQFLFGEYRYRPEGNKVMKWKSDGGSGDDPMFAEFALAPLWEVYEGVAAAAAAVGMSRDVSVNGGSGGAATHNGTGGKRSQRIRADTPGMDRVLAAVQTGHAAAAPASSATTTGSMHTPPRTVDELRDVLQRTGATSEEAVLRAVLRRYRPLSDAVLDAVCEHCPSPAEASSSFRTRALALVQPPASAAAAGADRSFDDLRKAVRACDPGPDAPTVAHVCKFMATDRSYVTDLPSVTPGAGQDGEGGGSMIMGLARVLSGTLRATDAGYYVFGPRYRPSSSDDDDGDDAPPRRSIRVYLLMGSSFVRVDAVPAGHICAVYDLEDLQLKTVTLCDRREGMPLRGFDRGLRPLVKVNVEPVSASDTDALERGLVKLSLADSAVEVTATAKGERILACLGEIHLEQSIRDLEQVYCGREISLRISDPIVEFGECTAWFENEMGGFEQFFDDKSPPLRQVTIPPYCYEEGLRYSRRGRSRAIISGRGAAISLRVVPLPRTVYGCLKENKVIEDGRADLIDVGKALGCYKEDSSVTAESVLKTLSAALCVLDGNGNAMLESAGMSNGDCIKAVLTFSGEVYNPGASGEENTAEPENRQPQYLHEGQYEFEHIHNCIRKGGLGGRASVLQEGTTDGNETPEHIAARDIWRAEMRGSAVAGLQLAMRAGPLCEEPVRGVMVVLEGLEIAMKNGSPQRADIPDSGRSNVQKYCSSKPLSAGMVVAALRSGIRCALLTRPARLVEGHLRLTLHSSLAGLGPLYAVLSKRRGKVVNDDMVDGTDLISITATLPQAESFHLAPELLKKSSGEVTAPELVFSHWEVLDENPFWIPTSLEEREDYGEILMNGDLSTGIDNNALKYIRMVRSRKGLLVDSSKIVVAAEKQRTLARKK